jgi:hypothetical protein
VYFVLGLLHIYTSVYFEVSTLVFFYTSALSTVVLPCTWLWVRLYFRVLWLWIGLYFGVLGLLVSCTWALFGYEYTRTFVYFDVHCSVLWFYYILYLEIHRRRLDSRRSRAVERGTTNARNVSAMIRGEAETWICISIIFSTNLCTWSCTSCVRCSCTLSIAEVCVLVSVWLCTNMFYFVPNVRVESAAAVLVHM